MQLFWVNHEGIKNAEQNHSGSGFLWVDCDINTLPTDAYAWREQIRLLTTLDIHEFHIADMLNSTHPSSFETTTQYECIILNSLLLDPTVSEPLQHAKDILSGKNPTIPCRPITFFVANNALITVHQGDDLCKLLQDFSSISPHGPRNSHHAPLVKSTPSTPLSLALAMINGLIDRYLILRQPLTSLIDDWQRELLSAHRDIDNWHTLLNARMTLRHLENLSEEQYDAIQELRDTLIYADNRVSSQLRRGHDEPTRIRINDLLNHIQRVQTHTARMESVIENAIQLHFSATANRTNEIIRVMTIITVIFTPLTLVASIFGMNFKHMPLLANTYGFWLTLGGMLSVGAISIFWALTRRYIRKLPNLDVFRLSRSIQTQKKHN